MLKPLHLLGDLLGNLPVTMANADCHKASKKSQDTLSLRYHKGISPSPDLRSRALCNRGLNKEQNIFYISCKFLFCPYRQSSEIKILKIIADPLRFIKGKEMDQRVASSSLRISEINMWPGVWVMQRSGFTFMTTAWGVTPQAQENRNLIFLYFHRVSKVWFL